jgi:hypothetical protein
MLVSTFATERSYGNAGLSFCSYDELDDSNRLLADVKILQWVELPDNISFESGLRNVHRAARILQNNNTPSHASSLTQASPNVRNRSRDSIFLEIAIGDHPRVCYNTAL